MRGVELIPLVGHVDQRGVLHAFESGSSLPFELARIFTLQGCPPDAVRACHAVTAHQAIVALTGGATADIDNGSERQTVRLEHAAEALLLWPGVWLRLRLFSAGTVLLVASSQRFADVHYFDTPQPHLFEPLLPRAAA
ncbi:MAG: FdtA/QdtA family cupin domain-containing protein [Planctomycetia bacterium]|nr:FdtA/QdtA family cupin domain-containing protein [Planctomycetia bacterium]